MTELPLVSAHARFSTVQSRQGRRRSGLVTHFVTLLIGIITLFTFESPAAAPNITRLTPVAIAPGKTSALTFSGDNLESIVDVWTSFACDVTLPKEAAAKTIEIRTPTDVGIGLGALRLVTTNGLSAVQFVLADPMPSLESTTTNHSLESAQTLPRNTAIDGVCEEFRSDFFRISANKGERLVIEAVAQRLGSPLDPLLRLLDSSGRELAFNDDAADLGSDAKLDLRCPKTGDYFAELRDNRYGGSARHRYRLRFGEPLPAPLPFLASKELTQLTAPLNASAAITEAEPNDDQKRSQAILIPARVSGTFAKVVDRDVFRFDVKKGERFAFTGRTHSLGSSCDLYLQLQTTNGTKIAESNPTGSDEGALTNRFSDAGTYLLVVEELNRNGGPHLNYQLTAEHQRPGFAASTEADRISGPAGEALELEVKVERRDYEGPITLDTEGLPPGFRLENQVIVAKTNATKLRITAPADAPVGDYFPFSLVARAKINDASITNRVSTMPALRTAFPALRNPPLALDGLITLSISESKSTNSKPPQKKRR